MEEESDFKHNNITIIGVGLIGGSIGLSLKKKNPVLKIVGVDRQEIITKALSRGIVDKGTINLSDGVKDADMVIIATPVKTIISLLSQIKPFLKKGCIVTDTGSTKQEIMVEAEKVFSKKVDFIGGHPLAGLERGGLEYASCDLFKEKPYLVIPKKENSFLAHQKLSSLINCLEAYEIAINNAQEHDQIMALVSHLPQLIAVIMTNMLGLWVRKKKNDDYFKISGKVFQEMTRVASSPFDIWKDIYQTNANFTLGTIEELERWVVKIKEKIARNPAELEEYFTTAQFFKDEMLKKILSKRTRKY